MTREELIKKIALKMDEISSSDEVIVPVNSSDNNPLYTQINNLLNESVNEVLMKAPVYRLHTQTSSFTPQLSTDMKVETIFNTRKKAAIAIPDDFLRLVSISDNSFDRPIYELAIEGDDADKRQHNKFLVAKSAKPIAVLSNNANSRKIDCYSYATSVNPSPTILYIKRYNNDKDSSMDTNLDDYLIDVVSWVCAGRVFAAQGDSNKGKICDENAAALMI
jgi:hypothetical protein